ncbi:MAG: nucleotidyltransferase domain-containing protein [Coriobacteriales bacterium]|jgi:predicted nucleotidyltransferase|nr:nucleotidyltransferase domain-containing protein [Coriobacteriales bacterium]
MRYTLEQIKAVVARYASENGIKSVWLFGSYADGRATDESDIDLLVEYYEAPSLLNYLGFQEQIQDELDIRVDVIRYPLNRERLIDPDFDPGRTVTVYG